MLSKKQTEDVCQLYQGPYQCRYLAGDNQSDDKFYCRKRTPDKIVIDELVDEYLRECRKTGEDPLEGGNALGDHCKGYFPFKQKLQGYDVEDV